VGEHTARRFRAGTFAVGLVTACVGALLAPTGVYAALPEIADSTSAQTDARTVAIQRGPAVTISDRIGDHALIDGLPNDPRSKAADIRSVRFEKVNGALRVTTTVNLVGIKTSRQYAVTSVTVPSGLKYLIQASTNTARASVAKQSWRNTVFCPDARSGHRGGSPGAITATIPLKCLGKPNQVTGFTAYTFTEVYSVAYGEYVAFSEDEAAGRGLLRLR
jgi:hypothetical protein